MEIKTTYICGVCKNSYDVKLECELCEKHHAEKLEWEKSHPPKFQVGDIVEFRSSEEVEPWVCRVRAILFKELPASASGYEQEWHYEIELNRAPQCYYDKCTVSEDKLKGIMSKREFESELLACDVMMKSKHGVSLKDLVKFL